MIKSVHYTDIIKILGKFLDENSHLLPARILNADSVRGIDLSEMISDTEMYSPNLSNSFLLFELLEDQNSDNYITKGNKENNMITIQSYIFHLMIYGNESPEDAQRISAIFKQNELVLNLRDSGIYINGVAPVESINEFINNTLIIRRDLDIKLQVRYEFEDVGEDVGYFKNLSTIIVETKSEKLN